MDEEICIERLEELVEEHMPFLVRSVSSFTGRYVYVEQDDEFSIALEAFTEAVERYEAARGSFLAFAGLVIRSRYYPDRNSWVGEKGVLDHKYYYHLPSVSSQVYRTYLQDFRKKFNPQKKFLPE